MAGAIVAERRRDEPPPWPPHRGAVPDELKLTTQDYPKIGRRIGRLALPTLFVMEGGYALEEIGQNAVGVLSGFEDG